MLLLSIWFSGAIVVAITHVMTCIILHHTYSFHYVTMLYVFYLILEKWKCVFVLIN